MKASTTSTTPRRYADLPGPPGLPLQQQDVVLALGLGEYRTDRALVALLDHCHGLLVPGGRVLVGNLAAGQPDAELMAHLLDRQAHHRTEAALRALAARSAFGGPGLRVQADEQGVTPYVVCARAG